MCARIKGRRSQCLSFFFSAATCLVWVPAAPAAMECWPDDEVLTYEVHWGMLVAAEGTFRAKQVASDWRLSLNLKSRGVVDVAVPIRSRFESQVHPELWRSFLFRADRLEASERLNYECLLPGHGAAGQYRDLLENKSRSIPCSDGPVQDLVSMLYAIRRHDWKRNPKMNFCVNDRWSLHNGRARLVGRDRIEDAQGEERECEVIYAEEVNEKGVPRKNGWLKLWFTTDEKKLPLQARLKFRYGTFLIRLTSAGSG